jgi:hypothetical protein
MSVLLGEVMSSPHFYPVRMDLARNVIWFSRLSKDDYRELPFLDSRAISVAPELFAVNTDDLLLYDANNAPQSAPVRYIFHPAFACSTLLARYLDLIPGCFVLKEPNLLTQVASTRPERSTVGSKSSYEQATKDWSLLLTAVMRLLTRKYCESDAIIIKAHDACNSLGEDLLIDNRQSKILFMSITLRTFLLSALKTRHRRGWLRARLGRASYDAARFEHLANVDAAQLTDAQAGAYLWLLNSQICRQLCRTASDSTATLCGETVADSPGAALVAATAFFGLTVKVGQIESILDDPSVSKHSKDSSLPYDSATRARDLAHAESILGKEVDEGVEWCRQIGLDAQAGWCLG